MKKALVLPALLFSLLAVTSGVTYAQDAQIKSVEFKNFERAEDSKKDELLKLTKKEYKEFDPNGKMVKYVLHLANPVGELVKNSEILRQWEEHYRSEDISKFDEMGDILTREKSYYSSKTNWKLKEEFTDYIKDPNQQFTRMYTYTGSGKPNKLTLLNQHDKKVGEEIFKYNKTDEEIFYKKWEMQPDGSKYQELKKTAYNSDGTLDKTETLIKDGKDVYKEIITFKRNKVVEHLKYKNNELLSSFGGAQTKYDPSKARVLMDFGGDGSGSGGGFGDFGLWATEDEFDDNGNKVKTIQTTDGQVTQVTNYKYDKSNNLVETITISYNEGKETNKEREVLEYDRNNNTLKKSVYSNGILVSENTYDYTYH